MSPRPLRPPSSPSAAFVCRMPPIWIFDLDNTLHHASPGVFPHINRMMTAYIMRHLDIAEDEAQRLRAAYWRRYGATLTGLVRHHAVDPLHFLRATHPVDELLPLVRFDPQLQRTFARLPGRKVLLSNGPSWYCAGILERLGIDRHFSAQFAIESADFLPKPDVRGYRAVLAHLRAPASRCIMVEDARVNLRTAKRLGMRTVWIAPGQVVTPGYVDHRIVHIAQLLELPHRAAANNGRA